MKIVVAPDSFKDAMRASEASQHIAVGLRSIRSNAEIDQLPVSDGGEGFTNAIISRHPAAIEYVTKTTSPLGKRIEAAWYMLHDDDGQAATTAVIELATASGLELVKPAKRDPTKTHTYGTGWLMREAIQAGATQILLGIGGSATNDAAMGIAFALQVLFYDTCGQLFNKTGMPGKYLSQVGTIDTSSCLLNEAAHKSVQIKVACDVDNPLAGPNGAAHVYAPQKGATPEQVEQLDAGLRHIARLWREQLGVDVEHLPGAGAAGGVGGGLVAMLGAELVPGAELVLDTIHFDERIKDADLIITGEGRLDAQSLSGKAVMAVAKRAKAAGVPCVALVGSVGEGAERMLDHGLSDIIVIGEGLDPAESIRRTGELLEQAAARLARERLN
ncbi:MAG: glycerate kinase [Phycisphaeraceae bacterium]